MSDALQQRLERVEARLRVVENALDREGIARFGPTLPVAPPPASALGWETPRPAPVAPPPPLPVPLPPAPLPQAARAILAPAPERATHAPAPPVDWERFFGLAVLGRVGVGAVLLAAGYFAQLAYREMSDLGRVISIYGLAAAFVGVGQLVRARVAPRYVALLWGGGAAAAYLAGAVARLRYELVGDAMGLVLLIGASTLGTVLARKLRHVSLASIALAGAFAAPMLTASTLEHASFVLVYLLALHGWSAWVEHRWSWTSARAVGVAGTLLVGGVWLSRHGALDTATYLHVHLYLFGLMAPELLRVFRSERVSPERQLALPLALAAAEGVLLLSTTNFHTTTGVVLPWTAVLAGAAWCGLALVLAPRALTSQGSVLVRGLARVGGVLLALGAFTLSRAVTPEFPLHPITVAVLATTGAAVLLLALRRRLGVGELAASVAVSLATAVLITHPDATRVFRLLPVVLAAAAWLVWTSRFALARGVGAWAGLAAVFFGLAHGVQWAHDPDWMSAAIAGGALWAAGVLELARARRETPLAWSGFAALALMAAIWTMLAFFGRIAPVGVPLVGLATLAGLAVAWVAALSAWRRLRTPFPRDGRLQGLLWALGGALVLIAGHREVVAAVAGLTRAARDGWHTLYLVAAAGAVGWIARGRPALVGRSALLLLGLALAKVLGDQVGPPDTPWAAAQLLSVLGMALALAWVADRRDRDQVQLALIGFAIAAALWVLYVGRGRLPVEPALVNLRLLVGILSAAGAAAFPFHRLRPDNRRAGVTVCLLGGLGLGFFAGLLELRARVVDLDGAWPDVLASVYMTLYAAVVLVVGFARADKRLRYPALGLFGVVVLKVGLHDLAQASTGLRIFVTGILGLVLLAAAFGYARRGGDKAGGETLPGAT